MMFDYKEELRLCLYDLGIEDYFLRPENSDDDDEQQPPVVIGTGKYMVLISDGVLRRVEGRRRVSKTPFIIILHQLCLVPLQVRGHKRN